MLEQKKRLFKQKTVLQAMTIIFLEQIDKEQERIDGAYARQQSVIDEQNASIEKELNRAPTKHMILLQLLLMNKMLLLKKKSKS